MQVSHNSWYYEQLVASTWRDEEVWVVSTPLESQGQPIGALSLAVHRDRVDAFLDESRNLFRLTGLIAVLAGVGDERMQKPSDDEGRIDPF